MLIKLLHKLQKAWFTSSKSYWEHRYASGGNSGPGSYSHLSEFKARVMNNFIREKNISNVIEFGCGDGNQLKHIVCPQYTGYDVSKTAVNRCKKAYAKDKTKRFFLLDDYTNERYELALSLDVIFHLVEDAVFHDYMDTLFNASSNFVIIYSSNNEQPQESHAPHVKHRNFSSWVDEHAPDWRLIQTVPNEYQYDGDIINTSFSNFYIYQRTATIER